MHKILFAALLLASTATASFAEEPSAAPAGSPPAASSGPSGGEGPKGDRPKMSFEERKAKALERIAKHKEKLAKTEACVNAAATAEALHECFPKWGKRGGGGEGGGWGERRKHRKGGEGGGAPDMGGED